MLDKIKSIKAIDYVLKHAFNAVINSKQKPKTFIGVLAFSIIGIYMALTGSLGALDCAANAMIENQAAWSEWYFDPIQNECFLDQDGDWKLINPEPDAIVHGRG